MTDLFTTMKMNLLSHLSFRSLIS